METASRTRQQIEEELRECCEARTHCRHDEYWATINDQIDALLEELFGVR